MPGMNDPFFGGALVFICEHTDNGAIGLIVNKPTDILLKDLFERLEPPLSAGALGKQHVCFGGPVQTERGFVLHDTMNTYNSSLRVTDDIEMTTSKDVLEHISNGGGPTRMLITLGYSGWSAGQLEKEIAENGWLTVAADPSIIFDLPFDQRHQAAMQLLGIHPLALSSEAGHA